MMAAFGVLKEHHPTIADAANVLENWQAASCAYNLKGLVALDVGLAGAGAGSTLVGNRVR